MLEGSTPRESPPVFLRHVGRVVNAVESAFYSPVDVHDALPTVLAGRFHRMAKLGRGATSTVWRCVDLVDESECAVKVLEDVDAAAEDRLRDEYSIVVNFKHPHIVGVRDFGRLDSENYYVSMDIAPGVEFREHLNEAGQLSEKEALLFVQKFLLFLSFIHSRGFLHCDLKPENAHVDKKGELHFLDFGLLHQVGATSGGLIKGHAGIHVPGGGDRSGARRQIRLVFCRRYSV